MPDRRLFTDAHAARLALSAVGQRYRPSNGTEGEMFYDRWCAACRHDINDDCPIFAATLIYDCDDPGYPDAWQYGADGQPLCTMFEDKDKGKHQPQAGPVHPNQLPLFAKEHPHA